MKKTTKFLVAVLVLGLCICVGFAGKSEIINNIKNDTNSKNVDCSDEYDAASTSSKENDIASADETTDYKEKYEEHSYNESDVNKNISAEDSLVKSEIEKHNSNAADFKKNRTEKIGNKTYDVCFLEVDSLSNYENVTYKNDVNDIFKYDVETGELRYANIESEIIEKFENSIDITTAQKIATDYVSRYCDIDAYTIDLFNETDEEYKFAYRRYICGYKTSDVFAINISFSGEVTYIINNTNVFDDVEISKLAIDKDEIESKLADVKSKLGDNMLFLEDSVIIVYEGDKLQLRYQISQDSAIGLYYIPIEITEITQVQVTQGT